MGMLLTLLFSLLLLAVFGAVLWAVLSFLGVPLQFLRAILGLLGLIWLVYAVCLLVGYAGPWPIAHYR